MEPSMSAAGRTATRRGFWKGAPSTRTGTCCFTLNINCRTRSPRRTPTLLNVGDWIPGVVHTASFKGSLAEKNNLTQILRGQGLRVHTARMGEEAGYYHLLQLLKAQKMKVFNTLTGFLSEYRAGDESALLLQCCYALLVSGRHCMRPKVAPQLGNSMPAAYQGERGWMA